jgi:hypothetical protein
MPYGYGYEDQPAHGAPYAGFNASGAAGSVVGGVWEGVASVTAENTLSPGDWHKKGVDDGRRFGIASPNIGGVAPTGNNLLEYNRGLAYGLQLRQQIHLYVTG